jgi:hypothetical protein
MCASGKRRDFFLWMGFSSIKLSKELEILDFFFQFQANGDGRI